MEVETLGVARSLGWRIHMRCNGGYRQETRSMREMRLSEAVGFGDVGRDQRIEFPVGTVGIATHMPGVRQSKGGGDV
jgi:hypothetical protein